ncbi:NmrA family NAD(P)-binding protein [Nocardia bovistercoris]|uniref:NmrA family NAD(P)-binding protein n=1 Tax=Nocardia bovistercoris TaxID=2785916 RepID=A0A931N3N9_9NOCA|nr:NmrA family NAD(P)-binding protein [Nocardia bovistercoris]
MTVLIPAVNGQVAAGLARRLRGENLPIRALARDRDRAETALGGSAGVEIQVGPLDDAALLAEALRDVDIAFLSVGTDPRQTELEKAFIDAAAKAALPHLIKLSTIDTVPDSPNPVGRWHADIERHLADSGVPHTILRPAYFTTNLLRTAAPSIKATGRWFGTSPNGRIAMIAPHDISEVAAAVVLDPALRGHTYDLTGPEALTLHEIAAILGELLGREITYATATPEQMREAMAARGVPDYYVEVALGIDRSVEAGLHASVTGTVAELIGRAPADASTLLARHLPAFAV